MVHFGSLVESSDKFKHIEVMTKVLDMALFHFRCERNIQHLTMEEKFIASNVPKPTLLRQVRQLEMFLKIKLNFYRFNFPKNELGKNNDLGAVLRLLNKLMIFRSEVLEINSFETFADIVQDCAIKCHELTYSNVFQECEEYQGKWGKFSEDQSHTTSVDYDYIADDSNIAYLFVKFQ